jgi:hypothetical protein
MISTTANPTNSVREIVPAAFGGLKWIEKGGGYYSECNKRLKGQG